jgi:uncharacterized protein (DUF1330 family)/glutaredoxin-related protein
MIKITLFGTPTSEYQYLKFIITGFLNFNKIPFLLKEVNEVSEFISQNILSIPCIMLDNEQIIYFHDSEKFKEGLSNFKFQFTEALDHNLYHKVSVPFLFTDDYVVLLQKVMNILRNGYAIIDIVMSDSLKNYKKGKQALRHIIEKITQDNHFDFLPTIRVKEERSEAKNFLYFAPYKNESDLILKVQEILLSKPFADYVFYVNISQNSSEFHKIVATPRQSVDPLLLHVLGTNLVYKHEAKTIKKHLDAKSVVLINTQSEDKVYSDFAERVYGIIVKQAQ